MIEAAWLLFVATSLLVIATPGQDMILVMSRSVALGPAAGVVTAAGVSIGLVGHTILAALGLGAILRASASTGSSPRRTKVPARPRPSTTRASSSER